MCRFLPAPSARRATSAARRRVRPKAISIHALREEGDFFWTTRPISSQYFYPRPPRGGRLRILNNFNNVELFLSTPSARRATLCRSPSTALLLISIHALREEGDTSWTTTRSLCINFYPRPPRGGRLQSGIEYNAQIEFLSTPSARRATCHFRSIPHWRNISIHALREEGDACVGRRDQVTHQFLSTPSARRATRIRSAYTLAMMISIHALREEGDPFMPIPQQRESISIHALREEGDSAG